jgi:hypothetical protein
MPSPKSGESEDDFVERCIPMVVEEGTAEDGKQAAAICHSMFREHKDKMTVAFLIDQFVATRTGEPYRLFPFGNFIKGGEKHSITPEIAAMFKLPEFKPPIKLGSHDKETPAGGWIVGLEVRADGLYAIPEYTPAGEKALAEGAYRYQSPEVIWEEEAIEDVKTGKWINGPMILGDALLHMPHLGEQAALFTVETEGANPMTDQVVSVPADLWSKLMAFLPWNKPEEDPIKPEETEVYKAEAQKRAQVEAERDALKVQVDTFEAETKRKGEITALVAELQNKEKFGMVYVELKGAEEAATMMSSMSPEQREWCMRNFSALALQASAITQEVGVTGGAEGSERQQFEALVEARSKEKGIDYLAAYQMVKAENVDLFNAAFTRKPKEA